MEKVFGIDRVEKAFQKKDRIKLMTHMVGGYPNLDMCEKLILEMANSGVEIIEIQLPFSDPPADGPIIVAANHAVLQNGVSTDDVLNMISRIRKKTDIALLIMSYLNPIYVYGVDNMIKKALEIGVDGFIIPDLTLDEPELEIHKRCRENNLALVPLIAPSTSPERIKILADSCSSPFVYAVLRLGVTGKNTELDTDSIKYLKTIKSKSDKKIAAGFGIGTKEQLDILDGYADCGIVGSALLRVVNRAIESGNDVALALSNFILSLR